ncbi:MAG: YfhO family protein, partial [Patescibacteria group bacterium]|nr:YfhO family protein [Patescibacteria group bacterium]
TNPKKLKLHVVITILIISISGGVIISELSPVGMMQRHDSFQHDPVTDFLKGNLNNSRMFSFDWTLAPNFPAAYKISTLGIMSASNIGSFYSFNHNFLDKDAWTSNLGYPSWVQAYGLPNSILKFFENKKYFDFLGVKYILTEGYDLNSFTPGGSRTGTYKDINLNNNNTGQSFIAPTESISGIGVSFGTYLKQNHGHVILTIDSVPYDIKYHRESIINAENILDAEFNEFKFTSPMTATLNKQFYLSLKYPESDDQNKIAVFYYGKNTDPNFFDVVKNNLQGQFYVDGMPVEEKELAFSIINTDIPAAFKFHDINIYENKDAYPRAYLVNKFHVADNGKAQDYLIQNPDFDLRGDVVLETQLPPEIVNQLKSSVQSDSSKANIISYDTNKVIIHTTSDSSLLLILTDTYYPGWKALVDGKETPIYRADGLVRSVFVPSGNHDVEFLYMPESFVTG